MHAQKKKSTVHTHLRFVDCFESELSPLLALAVGLLRSFLRIRLAGLHLPKFPSPQFPKDGEVSDATAVLFQLGVDRRHGGHGFPDAIKGHHRYGDDGPQPEVLEDQETTAGQGE